MKEGNHYNEKLFVQCYSLYAAGLRRYISRFVNDEFACEDIIQDVFLKLLERKVHLDPDCETLKAFLMIVAKNRTWDYLRRQRMAGKKQQEQIIEEITINEQFYMDAENAYIEGEVISTIHDVIDNLPVEKRQIFLKRMFFGMKIKEITREMRISAYLIHKVEKEVLQLIKNRVSQLII